MRWKGREGSENVEDVRGSGGGRRLAMGGGLGGLAVLLLFVLLGGDPRQLLNMQQDTRLEVPSGGTTGQPVQDEVGQFVSVVLKDTEDVWSALLREQGQTYQKPHLVLFSGEVSSACGYASAAVGPFYCSEDSKVYLDTSFFEDLERRIGAPGDFAQAYVIAHEVGHHVQNLMGISEQVHAMRGRVSEEEFNQISVRLELQADFFAGVWAHHAQAAKQILEPGDIDEALQAATAIGDDRLQMQSRGYVTPDSFTHGTSEQRLRWFRLGFETGDLSKGDTFAATRL
ncbi:MAG TPA: neutral zinc metallopeptidase [Candidatus Eisenbacteria bacterium]|nr:neutral zinc metallopeptidase [Candidatus Eisenbacteria bacterium]